LSFTSSKNGTIAFADSRPGLLVLKIPPPEMILGNAGFT